MISYTTIAVDASPAGVRQGDDRNRTGFAYYIRDDNGIKKHAWYEDKQYNSTEAEVLALVHALRVCKPTGEPSKVIVYADNKTVIDIVNRNITKPASLKRWDIYIRVIGGYLEQWDEVEARHVPAHTMRKDMKRFYLNYWCDVNSRAMMRHKRYHIDTFKKEVKK